MICQDLLHEHLLLPVHPFVPGTKNHKKSPTKRGIFLLTDNHVTQTRFLNGLLGGMKLSLRWRKVTFHVTKIKKGQPVNPSLHHTKNDLQQLSVPRSNISQKMSVDGCGWMVPPILVSVFQAGWILPVLLPGPESLQVLRKWGLFDLFSLGFRLCVAGHASVSASLSLTNGCWISQPVLPHSSGEKE